MAVEALETACFDRKKNVPGLTDNQRKSALNYRGNNFFTQASSVTVPTTFDKYKERTDYALLQLNTIERYLSDFRKISTEFTKNQKYKEGKELAAVDQE